jgi:cysteinyl-tRNA synthetase
MDDDLNTPLALSVLYELITETNKLLAENKLGVEDTKRILTLWKKMNKVFGLALPKRPTTPENITALAEERKASRINLDFKASDDLRDKIAELGYTIEDLKDNNYLIKQK